MVLIFCRDGHLRLKHEFGDANKIPLINMETMYDYLKYNLNESESSLKFWKNYWNAPVSFEEGLTFRNFFNNLAPWLDFFQDIIPHAVNLHTFLEEIKKPSITFTGSTSSSIKEPLCDLIVINQFTTMSPVMHRAGNSKNPYLPITETTGKWQHVYNMPLTGIYRDLRPETFNIENTQLNFLANKPILLNKNHYFLFDHYNRDVVGKHKIPEHIFNEKSYGVFEYNAHQHVLISEREISLWDLLNNIFKFFFTCPEERDISMGEIDKFLLSMSEDEANEFVQKENPEFEHKLIEAKIISDTELEELQTREVVEQIMDMNNQGKIATFYNNLILQKNAFTFMDYKIHFLKSSVDERLKQNESKHE